MSHPVVFVLKNISGSKKNRETDTVIIIELTLAVSVFPVGSGGNDLF